MRQSRNQYAVRYDKTRKVWVVCIGDGTGGGPLVLEPLAGNPSTPRAFDEATRAALKREGWEVISSDASGKRGIATPGPDAEPCYWAARQVKKTGPRQVARRLTGKPVERETVSWKVFYDS